MKPDFEGLFIPFSVQQVQEASVDLPGSFVQIISIFKLQTMPLLGTISHSLPNFFQNFIYQLLVAFTYPSWNMGFVLEH